MAHGDFVAIDGDGFIRLRTDQAAAVLARAAEIAHKEIARNTLLAAGSAAQY